MQHVRADWHQTPLSKPLDPLSDLAKAFDGYPPREPKDDDDDEADEDEPEEDEPAPEPGEEPSKG